MKDKGAKYTEREDEFIRIGFDLGMRDGEIGYRLGRDARSIKNRRELLGLYHYHKKATVPNASEQIRVEIETTDDARTGYELAEIRTKLAELETTVERLDRFVKTICATFYDAAREVIE